MEEETSPSPEYLKGFNEGYLLAKESPELTDKLSSIKGESDRTKGFLDGGKEYNLEKIRDLRPNWLQEKSKTDRISSKGRDREKDME